MEADRHANTQRKKWRALRKAVRQTKHADKHADRQSSVHAFVLFERRAVRVTSPGGERQPTRDTLITVVDITRYSHTTLHTHTSLSAPLFTLSPLTISFQLFHPWDIHILVWTFAKAANTQVCQTSLCICVCVCGSVYKLVLCDSEELPPVT